MPALRNAMRDLTPLGQLCHDIVDDLPDTLTSRYFGTDKSENLSAKNMKSRMKNVQSEQKEKGKEKITKYLLKREAGHEFRGLLLGRQEHKSKTIKTLAAKYMLQALGKSVEGLEPIDNLLPEKRESIALALKDGKLGKICKGIRHLLPQCLTDTSKVNATEVQDDPWLVNKSGSNRQQTEATNIRTTFNELSQHQGSSTEQSKKQSQEPEGTLNQTTNPRPGR